MHPPRLSRLDRIFPGLSIYFITFCTTHRRSLLANPQIHHAFRSFCEDAKTRQVWVGRYVIMPDHFHFFIDCGEETSLSDWMKALKGTLSKTLRAAGHQAPYWQKGFFDHLVRSESSYEAKWRYTRENPVRASLVAMAKDWPYQGQIAPLPFD